MSHTTGTALSVSTAINLNFSEAVDVTSIDAPGVITVKIGAMTVPVGLAKFGNDDKTVIINPIGVFPFGATLTVSVVGGAAGVKDLAGNALAASQTFTLTTEAAPVEPSAIRVNEVCASPRQDWNDSSGGNGTKFDGIPGTGLVTSDDEWIELVNRAPGTTNIGSFSIVVYAGPTLLQDSRLVTRLTAANTRIVGTGTLTASQTGDRIILGNPTGSIPASCFIELRDGSGTLIDHVEIGGLFSSSDRGGDGINNGAPGAGQDGSSTSVADETVGRGPDGADTGNDVNDWEYQAATPGTSN
jgi:hypothetical protein